MKRGMASIIGLLCLLLWTGRSWSEPPASAQPATAAAAQNSEAPARPDRALIISVDGCRPDMLLRADAPHVRRLMASGSFSFWARTTEVSITLPSHTSMLTGVKPEKHKISWNADEPHPEQPYPAFPTLFEVARKAGLTTAIVAGKAKFSVLAKPGTVDWSFIKGAGDDEVASHATDILLKHKPQVMFVHFPDVDAAGHRIGWGSNAQLAALENADKRIGEVLAALDKSGVAETTLVILTADHGGAGRAHGRNDPRSRHIPWIASGPGVKKNYDLTLDPTLVINTEDTFATACYLLGLAPGNDIDGKPVLQILDKRNQELLHAEP